MKNFTPREQIVETVNKLFLYTDTRNWDKLQKEVFATEVVFDVISLGAEKEEIFTARHICDMWQKGFIGLDAIHHQAGNYLVQLEKKSATVHAYAIASHYKKAALNGKTREYIGSYDLGLQLQEEGWRINMFKYNLKYMTGNVDMK